MSHLIEHWNELGVVRRGHISCLVHQVAGIDALLVADCDEGELWQRSRLHRSLRVLVPEVCNIKNPHILHNKQREFQETHDFRPTVGRSWSGGRGGLRPR